MSLPCASHPRGANDINNATYPSSSEKEEEKEENDDVDFLLPPEAEKYYVYYEYGENLDPSKFLPLKAVDAGTERNVLISPWTGRMINPLVVLVRGAVLTGSVTPLMTHRSVKAEAIECSIATPKNLGGVLCV